MRMDCSAYCISISNINASPTVSAGCYKASLPWEVVLQSGGSPTGTRWSSYSILVVAGTLSNGSVSNPIASPLSKYNFIS